MADKAILITKANVEELTTRFQNDNTGVMPAIGYYLVAQFGQDGDYDIVSPAIFNEKFTKGETLRNGFFEAVRRPVESYSSEQEWDTSHG